MSDDHHDYEPNPDYDGPGQHCLPPEVKDTFSRGLVFTILMILLALGAAYMGAELVL